MNKTKIFHQKLTLNFLELIETNKENKKIKWNKNSKGWVHPTNKEINEDTSVLLNCKNNKYFENINNKNKVELDIDENKLDISNDEYELNPFSKKKNWNDIPFEETQSIDDDSYFDFEVIGKMNFLFTRSIFLMLKIF